MSAELLRVVEGGRAPRGWEALWAKDVWRQGELPHGDLASTYNGEVLIHFERLRQPWLKEAAKRWARARLLGDTTPQTMSRYLADLWHFSDWLAAHAPETVVSSRGLATGYPSSSVARSSISVSIRPTSRCWMTSSTGRSCCCSPLPGSAYRAW
jgi:hypothetical protein